MNCKYINQIIIISILTGMLVLLSTCTPHGLIGELPVVKPDEYAEIIIIRPDPFRGAGSLGITLDGKLIFGINKGEHTIVRIPKGEHTLGVEGTPQYDVGLEYEAGKSYYYLVKLGYANYGLIPIAKVQSKSWLANSKYIQIDKNINE